MGLSLPQEIRCIRHPKMKGSLDMAVDEALAAAVPGGPPVIRLYGFTPATLSVGRFQRTEGVVRFDRLAEHGVELVRRPTGGQAVLHDNELTYAVILARDHVDPFRKRRVYRVVSELLLAALAAIGVDASFSSARRGDYHHPDCFATTGEYEIITARGRKLIGSAQTTTRTSCLQHGSIPLGPSAHTAAEYLAGDAAGGRAADSSPPSSLEEELGRKVGFEEAQELFFRALGRVLALRESELTDQELSLSRELACGKYESPAWNRSR